jgi:hypothetical protein
MLSGRFPIAVQLAFCGPKIRIRFAFWVEIRVAILYEVANKHRQSSVVKLDFWSYALRGFMPSIRIRKLIISLNPSLLCISMWVRQPKFLFKLRLFFYFVEIDRHGLFRIHLRSLSLSYVRLLFL